MKTVYVCGDSVTGILSAVYDAWKSGKVEEECEIALRDSVEQQLFCEYAEIEETGHKAIAVERLIKRHLGREAYWDIYHAALSKERDKGDAILGTMMAAKNIPDSTKIMNHLSHPKVERVFELSRNVGGEAHAFKGFLRFRELTNGVLVSEITPKNQVLTCLAPHFADRLPLENWMIYDKTHNMFVVHEAGKRWVLGMGEQMDINKIRDFSEKEREFARLWKGFCSSISIEMRENRQGQLQHLPIRFRSDMVEFESSFGVS